MIRTAMLLLSLLVIMVPPASAAPTEIIVDTDLGDDLDDAFALALVLSSPELALDGITTSLGDTRLRARMAGRLLALSGRPDIPVAVGPATAPGTRFTQSDWAAGGPDPVPPRPDAVEFVLDRLRAEPAGRITLVALAPLTTIAAMIARDPNTFRRLRRVVMMGGSVRRGYGSRAGTNSARPGIEYNVRQCPACLRALLAAGVPVELLPLDATEIALNAPARARLFGSATPAANWLSELYPDWARQNAWGVTPTLFDVVPVARLLQPSVCRPVPMRLTVSDTGWTQPSPGRPNLSACLGIDRAAVLNLLQRRVGRPSSRCCSP